MFKSLIGSIAYGILRQRAPLFFVAIDVANAFISQQQPIQEIQEPEIVVKAKRFMNLSDNPSVSDIKQQYKSLAKIHHPDKQSGSEDKMKLLNMYYEELLNYYKE